MDLDELISALESLQEPSRRIDEQIGRLAGWERRSERANDNNKVESVYFVHNGKRYPRMPYFTTSIDAALLCVEALVGKVDSGGVTLNPNGMSWAEVGGGPRCRGPNPAIALCIAALRRKQQVQ